MLRILVVDDSSVARQMITEMLSSDAEIEVVGTAKDGREAVAMAVELKPDLITMDIMMPEMDGFEATKEIMINQPTPIVIVSASTTVNEVATGMRALRAGALTLKLKPPGPHAPGFDEARQELIETVKMMAEVKVVRHYAQRRTVAAETLPKSPTSVPQQTYQAIGIAASTGGPPALQHLLGKLPEDFPVPILTVQHIADGFVEGFARWLDSVLPLTVKIGEAGELMNTGTVYIAPQDQHMGVTRGARISLCDDEPISGFRPSGSYLFDSLAAAFGERTIGVVLTGMGRDGVSGLHAIHQAGGLTFAQDEQSCVVFGMPGSALSEGIVDAVYSLDYIARQLCKLTGCSNAR